MSDTDFYEFNGEIYENTGEFLDAVSHAYKTDHEAAVQALEDYGFDRGDIRA